MLGKILTTALISFWLQTLRVTAQGNSPYCDSSSGICYQGYTDTSVNITIGLVFPPLQPTGSIIPNSTEFIAQVVTPVSYGWTGLSVGGQMADSLLFPLWPYNNEIIIGPRWTSGYVLPTPYAGPIITLLPDSEVNSTYIKATFRCQNCTAWLDGSIGSGDLNSYQTIAYVTDQTTGPDDPADVTSSFQEHTYFSFFGLDLTTVHSSDYYTYISEATQTEYGQCGGTDWDGPTVCVYGTTCTAVSPPYYSQCL